MDKKERKIDNFKKNSIISIVVLFLGSGMGAIFQIFSARILDDVSLYADLNAVLSFQTIIGIPTAIVVTIITKYVSELYSKAKYGKIKGFLKKMLEILLIVALILLFIGIVSRQNISEILHIDNDFLIWISFINIAFTFLLQLINGTIQGMQLFFLYGIVTLLGQSFKIIGMFCANLFNQKLEVIFIFILLGTICSLAYGIYKVKAKLQNYRVEEYSIVWSNFVAYMITVILANVAITLMTNVDMMLVKAFFDQEAGLYSVALILGKVVYYIASAIAVVLFPMVVGEKNNQKNTFQLFMKSIYYNSALALLAIVGLCIFGKYIIKICYGEMYMEGLVYILPITAMIFPMNILTLIINYLMARNVGKKIYFIIIGGVVAEFLSMYIYHKDLVTNIWIMATIIWVTLIVSFAEVLRIEKRERHSKVV